MTAGSVSTAVIPNDKTFTAISYNIGFGAYSPEYDFFMDGGKYSTAFSKADVETNTDGAARVLTAANADFAFIQEMDIKSTRSYKVNQYDAFKTKLPGFASFHAVNFHSAYLAYPFNDPHGSVNSGMATFSRYKLADEIKRYELPVTDAWPTKFFDLDRCFTVSRIALTGGKELVLVNVHLSAYDEGGTIRAAQLAVFKEFLQKEKNAGNYIVAGGDFNHDLISTFGGKLSDHFKFDKTRPIEAWVQTLPEDFTSFLSGNGYSVKYAVNEPSCRSSGYPYKADDSAVWAIDGFIVSGGIDVESVKVADGTIVPGFTNFLFSDHNPVIMKFKIL